MQVNKKKVAIYKVAIKQDMYVLLNFYCRQDCRSGGFLISKLHYSASYQRKQFSGNSTTINYTIQM